MQSSVRSLQRFRWRGWYAAQSCGPAKTCELRIKPAKVLTQVALLRTGGICLERDFAFSDEGKVKHASHRKK